MGIEEVRPEEELRVLLGDRPVPGAREDLARAPLGELEPACLRSPGKPIVVEVEPLVEPELAVEDIGPDERRRRESPRLQFLGKGLDARGEAERAVGPHPVRGRREARQDRRVRGERDGHGGRDILPDYRFAGERVENRRLGRPVAVAAEVVRAKGVDRDEDDLVGSAPCLASAASCSWDREQEREEQNRE